MSGVGHTCRFTTSGRRNRFHRSNRPCVARPLGITDVLISLNVSASAVYKTLLRSMIRSARAALSSIGGLFNRSMTILISKIAGLSRVTVFSGRRRRTRGIHGVFVSVTGSIQMVVVGLNSQLRGVQALNCHPRGGHETISLRAVGICMPLTGHLKVVTLGRRLRRVSFDCLSPCTCGRVRRVLRGAGSRHRSFVGLVGNEVLRHLSRRFRRIPAIRKQIGDICNVCGGICRRNGAFSRVFSGCTIQIVISSMARYCCILNMVRSVFSLVPGHFGSCVSAPGTGVCRSLRAAIAYHRNVPFRIRVHA